MAAPSLHFLSLTPQTLSLPPSSSSPLFTPFALKPLPKPLISLSSINRYARSTFTFVRCVAVSSELEEEVEDGEEDQILDFSGADQPTFSPDLKLFVGNLPFTVDSAALAGLFEQAGNVEMVEVIYDKFSGKKVGVLVRDVQLRGKLKLRPINGYELQGRVLRVNSGPPPAKSENPSFRGPRGRERTSSDSSNKLYVGNLAWGVDNLALETLLVSKGMLRKPGWFMTKKVVDREVLVLLLTVRPKRSNSAIEELDGMGSTVGYADALELMLDMNRKNFSL
ncbi:UNVERIFIED_CONTAM: ribonucleoprotein A, chloroplastic [Sesamum angustifolium]|uniref:Ribonucleoprotein A, chloroplastic n=1 Tax=Sesamum angustifolium TaxID=2727405 RepID=A0AAW2N5W3_9LAMI